MTAPAKITTWRDVLPVHPAADLFPMMTREELIALGEDIKKNGLRHRVAVIDSPDDEPILIDGRNRLDAMQLVGLDIDLNDVVMKAYCRKCRKHGSGFDPYDYVISANIHRRHLTAEQRRDLIAKRLKATPDKSNRQIEDGGRQPSAYRESQSGVGIHWRRGNRYHIDRHQRPQAADQESERRSEGRRRQSRATPEPICQKTSTAQIAGAKGARPVQSCRRYLVLEDGRRRQAEGGRLRPRRGGWGALMKHTPPPSMADDRGESDHDYFRRHPEVRHRFRLPFPDEFSAAMLSEARIQARGEVLVLVVIDRDARGRPSTRARGLVCLPGGTA
jgi:hypothetical protein